MDIYNVLGQKVTTIVNESMQAGTHNAVWDGRDENGRHLSSGVYIAQISSPDGMKTLPYDADEIKDTYITDFSHTQNGNEGGLLSIDQCSETNYFVTNRVSTNCEVWT